MNVKSLSFIVLMVLFSSMLGQKSFTYGDSLAGFNEANAKAAAFQNHCFGAEFPVYMEAAKRQFISSKYNIKTPVNSFFLPNFGKKVAVAPACVNEDFEDPSGVGNITTSNQVNGWTVGYGQVSGANAVCNLNPTSCCNNAPQECQVFSVPGGLTDPVIGATYKIYSVFGSGAANPGIATNPQTGLQNMYGNNFIRINSNVGNPSHNSVSKLSKTFAVTANNALFQFAFISVFNPEHACCDAPSMQIILTNATTNSVLPCPNFSVSVPTPACTNTNTMQYYVVGTGANYVSQSGVNVFNKWKLNTLDLTAYINQNITIDVLVSDCPYGGHFGYTYFDAQCSPMNIIGNNSNFPAGTASITLPTCGAAGATITLPSGLGPYSWNGPGITGNWTVPSFTNQTIVSTVNGTLNAIMNPAGSCAPIIRNITVSITPAPNLILTPIQPSCSNSVATLSGTLTVGATPMSVVITGPTGTVATNVSGNTLQTGSLQPGPHTIVLTDGIGCLISQVVNINPPLAIPSFTVGSPGNDYTLTCLNTPITMTASSFSGPLTYTWTSSSGTVTGPSANVSQAGIWQVVGQSPVSGCSVSVNFTIAQNYNAPLAIINPTVMNITCNVAASTFTGTSPTGTVVPNITTNWYQVSGTNTVYVGVPQSTINIFQPGSPGIYWFEAKDNLTGCVTTKSVLVTSSLGVPQFTVTSPSNFTVGCSTKSVTSMQVSNVVTSPANLPVEYFFSPPPGTLTPGWQPNPNQNGITTPGVWVIYVRDQTNLCLVTQSISIIQNTIAPNVDFLQPLPILTCKNPTMELLGVSSNSNTILTWTVPAIPSNSVQPTATTTVVINPAVANSSVNITSVGVFTVGAVDNNNLCKATKTVQILQDIRLPIFTISALTNSVINCINPDVVIVPVTTTLIAGALVPQYFWYPPVGNGAGGSSFNTTTSGSHTAIATSITNGCTLSASYNVGIDLNPPAVDFTPTYTLDCGTNPTVSIRTIVTGTTSGFTYNWYIFPPGVVVSNPTSSVIIGSKVGEYGVTVTNTINGCKADGVYHVEQGELTVDFTPSATEGFAPLAVTFANNSASSFTTGSMVSNWSFGNGSVLTNTYTNGTSTITPSATYLAPGTYSVLLNVNKGTCSGSKVRTIVVEVPSKMEVPNVFTPNGDKVNDIFRLIASSLSEVQAVIFDRWGNRVYDVNSSTGNIAWDGKNLSGKDCPAGTYFYIIKATGKDGETYDVKGNVTLFR